MKQIICRCTIILYTFIIIIIMIAFIIIIIIALDTYGLKPHRCPMQISSFVFTIFGPPIHSLLGNAEPIIGSAKYQVLGNTRYSVVKSLSKTSIKYKFLNNNSFTR